MPPDISHHRQNVGFLAGMLALRRTIPVEVARRRIALPEAGLKVGGQMRPNSAIGNFLGRSGSVSHGLGQAKRKTIHA